MRCPFCGHSDTAVKDSRPAEDASAIKRRRFCSACGSRFTTVERVQLRDLFVIKRNGTKVAFDREKLARSIFLAMRKRPIEPERIERVVNSIVRQLETIGENEIASIKIGEIVMDTLRHLDHVAYVRFASIYKAFQNINDFETFLEETSRDQPIEDEDVEISKDTKPQKLL